MTELMYFGKLTDIMGCGRECLDLPETVRDTEALRLWLDTHRSLGGVLLQATVRIAVNDEIVTEPCAIDRGDRIAFLPPVGGG